MKYGQTYKEIDTKEDEEENTSKPILNNPWYDRANRRVRRSEASFFPFPDLFIQNFNQARNKQVTKRKVDDLILPVEGLILGGE